ncbi:hypothetical protein RCCGE510_27546 (plasmid) [Rhizobium sp. CCGE 510]|nr:hypothetical protein RCCGE510_27546 [Rhizobium sp. CCGE 510]
MPRLATAPQGGGPANQEPTAFRIRINDLALTATLYDNPSARDLASMLPLDLKIEDYGNTEKIVHLPRKLTEEGSGLFGNEQPGDLCYFKPWGKPRPLLRRLPLGRTDPARPLRHWFRAAARAGRISGAYRTDLTIPAGNTA